MTLSCERPLKRILCALLGSACLGFAAPDVRVAERQTLAPPAASAAATHSLGLEVYIFARGRWRRDDVAAALPRAAELLAQCSVALDRIELVVLEAPPRYRDYDTPVSRELARALDIRKPALFFVDDTRNDPAFDAEAIGLANARTRPELANTVWIAYGARDLPNTVAHELVHVLSDSGTHSVERGNLMRDETSPADTVLTNEQCARVRSRGAANRLLLRRRE